jgi:hypothetical protein
MGFICKGHEMDQPIAAVKDPNMWILRHAFLLVL